MQVKISELSGVALDWAVAKCEGVINDHFVTQWEQGHRNYSSDWAQGGPIIDDEGLSLAFISTHKLWVGSKGLKTRTNGQTPLIAAMRCYVASKLGDTVEIPEGLKNA